MSTYAHIHIRIDTGTDINTNIYIYIDSCKYSSRYTYISRHVHIHNYVMCMHSDSCIGLKGLAISTATWSLWACWCPVWKIYSNACASVLFWGLSLKSLSRLRI